MPRKTGATRTLPLLLTGASMRPRPDAAENVQFALELACLRPQHGLQ